MYRRIRSRLTYANVTATLALFMALATGGAYAANTIYSDDIVDGQVKRQDIGYQAVTQGKIADGTISTSKYKSWSVTTGVIAPGAVTDTRVAPDAVTGAKVADNSLGLADIDEASLMFGTVIPAARVESSVSQSSGTEPIHALSFDVESFDTASLHNADQPTRLSAPIDGIYQITGGVFWDDPGTSSVRAIQILENGVDCHSGGCKAEAVQGPASAATGGFQTVQSVSTLLNLKANDYVELGVAHNVGESPSILGSPHDSTFFGMAWLGPLP